MSDKSPPRQSSRRSFIKQSTATVAGASLAASIASRAHAASTDEIKCALIGCGGRGTGAVTQFLSTTNGPIRLYAMADAYKDRLEDSLNNIQRGAKGYPETSKVDVPEERRFVGLDAYKKAIDCGVDMVILTTPPGFRPLQFEYAVKQGKNIFSEKPVATDAPGIRRFLAAVQEAKKKNLKVGIGLQRHHQASYIETIKRLQDGAIGDINFMRAYWDGGGVWVRPRQPGMTEMQYQVLNWYYFTWMCGDHIVEQHIHNIDVCNWLKGTHPIAAQGQGGRQVRTAKEYGQIFDHHSIEFTYADGSTMISQCRHIKDCYNSVSEHAHGSKGYCNISGAVIEPKEGEKWRFRGSNPNPYQVEHDDLQNAIRNNLDYNEGEYGAMSTMTAIYGRMASYSGKLIRWDDAFNSKLSLAPGIDDYTWDTAAPVQPDADGFYPVPMPGSTQSY
ncbi:MAG: twin-arginine translocation signal domain-containing protein [Planctomycetes bacterium]|nr:twin-arginine translocation signal domain-containing protein [Planctomycetota bacterium]